MEKENTLNKTFYIFWFCVTHCGDMSSRLSGRTYAVLSDKTLTSRRALSPSNEYEIILVTGRGGHLLGA